MNHDPERPLGQLLDYTPPEPPPATIATQWVTLNAPDPARDSGPLFRAAEGADWIWDYMGYGPFADAAGLRDWLASLADSRDPHFYAIRAGQGGEALGLASYLRIDRGNGVIEIGHILMPPPLQRTREASAAIMAMIQWAFEAGYRRVEWKCNALNAPSRRAADRYGFRYEGTFRNHMITKGRNRDTAWYAITDQDWPAIAGGYARWLEAENFDAEGRQRAPLRLG